MMQRWLFLALPLVVASCIDAIAEVVASAPSGLIGGQSPGGEGGTGIGGSAGEAGGPGGSGGTLPLTEADCQGHIYECGDTVDNDGDELFDAQDPDCLGPCDDTEDSYFPDIPGSSGPPCALDCYFDQDSGAGNDDCYWDHRCDPFEVPPSYYPEPENGAQCSYDDMTIVAQNPTRRCNDVASAQSQECLEYCGPLTPNGCDCFGCCFFPQVQKYVWIGSEGSAPQYCTEAELDNPDVCHPCTPVSACLNDCKNCELCVGKTILPPECGEPEGGIECPAGVQRCGLPGLDPCPSGSYCITGCCQAVPE